MRVLSTFTSSLAARRAPGGFSLPARSRFAGRRASAGWGLPCLAGLCLTASTANAPGPAGPVVLRREVEVAGVMPPRMRPLRMRPPRMRPSLGAEIEVNTYTMDAQGIPGVAMDAGGDFVVVWDGRGQGDFTNGIFARRYDATGTPKGADFLVNTYTTLTQSHAAVAMDDDGDFIVAWDSFQQDGSSYGVYAKVYQADGTPLPVELSSFTATRDGEAILLRWATASETSNAGFEVQRRAMVNGQPEWQPLAFVEGRGTTSETQHYAYRAEGLAPGRHRFRLRQVDFDGAFAYSLEVEVGGELAAPFVLSPSIRPRSTRRPLSPSPCGRPST